MEQKEKELLLKYLCAALPYGVKTCTYIPHIGGGGETIERTLNSITIDKLMGSTLYPNEKPYLRPMSSMTGKERREFRQITDCAEITVIGFGYNEGGTLEEYTSSIPFHLIGLVFNWLLEHHFDFMGLIEKGLAIEVTESNNPYMN